MTKKESKAKWKYKRFIVLVFLCMAFYLVLQIFLISLHRVPSSSMNPELIEGDYILVWKPTYGARLFDVFSSMKGERIKIHRIPGFKHIRRNDVVVFNTPYPQWDVWDKIEMHILKYYVKRCIGLPGDSLSIEDGFYQIRGTDSLFGNIESQKRLEYADEKKLSSRGYFTTLPFDSIINWNIKDFGPLYIPSKGDSILMNRKNYLLYKRLIEWEQKCSSEYQDSSVLLNAKPIVGYRFRSNYYFMAGDNNLNSVDSRFWGLVPEEFIVGKACLIYKSINPHDGKFRWNRFMKTIH